MKIRLMVGENRREAIQKELNDYGIQIDDDADLVLTEAQTHPGFLPVRNDRGDRVRIGCGSIQFIESYGHDVEVHTTDGVYTSQDRLYQLEAVLDPGTFVRVSNSVIISRKYLRKIKPSLSMKFVLTMADGTLIDVTRSYYAAFKEFIGI